jgi:hypothetical protein
VLVSDMGRTSAAAVWSTCVDDSRGNVATACFAARVAEAKTRSVGVVMTIYQIRSTLARRAALVATVLCILVCLGPLALIRAALTWVEDEFELDMRDAWDGIE